MYWIYVGIEPVFLELGRLQSSSWVERFSHWRQEHVVFYHVSAVASSTFTVSVDFPQSSGSRTVILPVCRGRDRGVHAWVSCSMGGSGSKSHVQSIPRSDDEGSPRKSMFAMDGFLDKSQPGTEGCWSILFFFHPISINFHLIKPYSTPRSVESLCLAV